MCVAITPSALTADELLPILVYLVIISDIPNWHGNMAYINNFHFSRIGVEEFAYVCLHLLTETTHHMPRTPNGCL